MSGEKGMDGKVWARSLLGSSLALALAACGSGSGTKSTPPDPPPTAPPPTPAPEPAPQPAMDAHLALTNAKAAHAMGLTGAGIRIGVIDSGVMRSHPALAGRVMANYHYVDPRSNNLAVDDVVGHGTTVAQLAAGAATGQWPGGIAPGAGIVSARIISDKRPTDDGSGQGNEVTGALGMASVHDDLVRAGMRIMNNSWGGLYWTRPTATAPIAAEYRPFIIDHDGLVVFATGNESRANPTDMAALPSKAGPGGTRPAADLERGWLAVAALDTANPDRLAGYSNACGIARNYCLVAPGTATFIGADSTAGSLEYYYGSGTSYAAPLVSGAAALVWQAFPYFNNDLVRQTLLGTATDLGDPGPDAVFGYGLLNVGKAVKGPAKFDWGDMVVDVDVLGLQSVWSNDISGDGGLVKRGAGALGLSGTSTYAGATRIERGTLSLRDGASIRSDVTILPQEKVSMAALQFVGKGGRVTGNVDNSASLVLYGDGTEGTIDGNYLHRDGAQLRMMLGLEALQVTGTATLQGGGVLINGMTRDYVPQDGARQDLIHAQQGLHGQFKDVAEVTANTGLALLQSRYGYDGNTAWLELERVNVVTAARAAGLGADMLSAAWRVEQAFDGLDGNAGLRGTPLATAAGALQRGEGGFNGMAATLDTLSGQAHAAATAMTFDSLDMTRRALSAQFVDSRGMPPANGGAWMRALGSGGQGGYLGSDYSAGGWMLGREASLGGNAVLGFAFGEMRAHTTAGVAQDRSRDRQTQSQLYAGWHQGNAYVLGQAGFGQYRREMDRGLLLGGQRAGVHARYGGSFLAGSVETGYRIGLGAATLTPYLGAGYTRIDSDAFHEQGGHGFGLRANGWSSQRTQALAGLRGQYLWRGVTLNGYAEWQQTVAADGLSLRTGFTGIDAWAPLGGLQPAGSSGLFGLSLDSWLSRNARLSLGHDRRVGPRGDNRQVWLRFQQAL